VNLQVAEFYECQLYRKIRIKSFFTTRKSKQRLAQRFKEIFGSPREALVGIGDWEQKKHCKFKEPLNNKDFMTLL
jgi:hypothetical protein